ncbi:hypothetical protein D6853_01200 [Butyrivibrio sp. X503]|uniref:hypothetical protein n=1 Tax=Butyrivibrio sp. X503 TaxID=2364878 RepID=UPI000EA85215|nr:hypothetical protein [Butyrivibrio sp. X503]RKM58184.1 hypothetical protein D6853_01200 [Butyrivibrio sp. X503]
MLSEDERYDLFKCTLQKSSSNILSMNDDDFRYTLFEELPPDIISFLHNNTLDLLIDEGYIDETIYKKCSELREIYIGEEKILSKLSDMDKIRASTSFRRIIKLADEIINLLYI